MDIRILRYFLTIAKEGNITKAAEKLHITQPTLSRQLMELEDRIGTKLLIRGKKQITLTDKGVLLEQRAKEIIALLEKTERDISEDENIISGIVSIGCVETIASKMLPKIMKEFKEKYPMVNYELYSADSDDIKEKIDRGDIDVGILLEPVESAKYEYIRLPYYEQFGVVMKEDNPLALKSSIKTEDLVDIPIIIPRRTIVKDEIAKWLGVSQDKINIIVANNFLTNALLLVEEEFGCVISVEGALSIRKVDGICFVPFSPKRVTGHVLIWKKNKNFPPATSLFIQFIKELYN